MLIRKPPGPAETGHLTPRSRTTSASSASMMSPMSETRPSSETRLGLTAKQGIHYTVLKRTLEPVCCKKQQKKVPDQGLIDPG